jgi:hypothetical protein
MGNIYVRVKDRRWIIQKNISSDTIIEAFLDTSIKNDGVVNPVYVKETLRKNGFYNGRSEEGSISTMGVRLSQMCFYMMGYKSENRFIPSPTTRLWMKNINEKNKYFLINLFAMQYPSPYSETFESFKLFFGRLIVKLLLDERIKNKLYIDECIWFLPFIETIDEKKYEDLVLDINNYRKLSFDEKMNLFKSVNNYDDVFSNCLHEMNYYLFRIFESFGVINIVSDPLHNEGNLLKFRHGNSSTYRYDAYGSRKSNSGYIRLDEEVLDFSKELIKNYSPFEMPITQATAITKQEWIKDLYEFDMLKYLNTISTENNNRNEIISAVKNMVYESKFGSNDGKSFEKSLKEVFELFREAKEIEIISGSGDTDLLCIMMPADGRIYKVNVDAKKTNRSLSSINPVRIKNHIKRNGSKYCIIVSPRFARGVNTDIEGTKIVTVKAESLASYCLNECLSSDDLLADYTMLDNLIERKLGSDISEFIDQEVAEKYGLKNT